MSRADRVFGGRYQIVGEVGRGGMGVIFRGVDSVLDREVAIKVMSGDYGDITDDQRARFFREAKAAARLQHRNIVTVFEFAEQDGVPYIVMEFLKGRSLSSRMAAQPPLSLEQKLDIMCELCNGLHFAHQNGVVHRDVKPANVWLLEDGAVKLVDFGIAKFSSSMTMHGDVMGSASYMSPEQIEGTPVTGRSDVFSAAVMLYEIIARRRPFEGDSPTATMMQIVHRAPPPIESIVPDLPRELISVIAKGLEKNPDDRYQSAEDFGSDLQLIRIAMTKDDATVLHAPLHAPPPDSAPSTLQLKSEPLPSRPATVQEDTKPASHRLLPWIALGAAVLTVAIGGWFWATSPSPGASPGPVDKIEGKTEGKGKEKEPPPPPPPPPAASLRVNSKPPGAQIFLDGVATGQTTPADVKIAAGGSIRLELRSYEGREAVVSESDLRNQTVEYELKSIEGPRVDVRITGSYEFEVFEGSKKLSDAATEHKLPARVGQELTLRDAKHFLDQKVRVQARGGRVGPITAPELGDIVLTGNESCLVYIDGLRADYLRRPLSMASGTRLFTFKCKDGTSLPALRLKIAPGENEPKAVK